MIGIIDYGMGNLGSVSNACRFLELDSVIVSKPDEMAACSGLILPGVGAFGDCMQHLVGHGFTSPVKQWIGADKPFLGLCLGLQVLFEGSEESPGVAGLGVLPGQVQRFRLSRDWKVPQIGWNRVRQARTDCPLFHDVPDESYFYFVHSFYAGRTGAAFEAGLTNYGLDYTSVVWQGRMMACQFHPEKSQKIGLQMLNNFGRLCAGREVGALT
ncbi:MAG TPA: imidazole glycerol phosphate synthase subunit HisH [Verrucomicrobia bacterium]|nr:MAG: imidazole glycerol phosphate synthase, glutamine amidotransferase subunit [Lentisphaerae bacterium GWF2_57_35]HBA83306.1 imidazole glycerol phosphate synthase subunit HisH [Verrucomicrobiota bacterium]